MKTLLRFVLAGALVSTPGLSVAQTAAPVTIERAERYTLTASKSKNAYLVDMLRVDSTLTKLPENYKLPVIYVLDGSSLFPFVAQMVNTSVTFSSQIPAALVVSVSYVSDPALTRGQNITNQLSWRNRDFAPAMTSGQPLPPNMANAGGAADFLAFINHDLKPFVASRHPVDAQDQTLVGHSLSGLFTVYTLLNSPASFQRYVAMSPSVYWDDHAPIKQAATFQTRFGSVLARVFISVGGLETKAFMGEDMIGDAKALASMLETQKDAGLQTTSYVFPDENHLSVVPGALMRGLREVGALR